MATTLDGKIAKDSNHPADWTGKADKKYFIKMTKKAGVVIMGSKTYDTIGKPLPGRLNVIMTRDKTRQSDCDNLIFTDQTPGEIVQSLEQKGYDHAILAGGATINSLFADANLIDHIHLVLIPKLFGTGVDLFSRPLDRDFVFESSTDIGDGCLLVVGGFKNVQ